MCINVLIASTGHVAHLCPVVFAYVFILEAVSPAAGIVCQVGGHHLILAVDARRKGFEVHQFSFPDVVGREQVVFKTQVAVVFANFGRVSNRFKIQGFFVNGQCSDIGAGKNLALQSQNRKVLAWCALPIVIGLHVHQANAPVFIQFPTQSSTVLDRRIQADAAGEKRANVGVTHVGEQVPVFQKELPPLREKQFKTI